MPGGGIIGGPDDVVSLGGGSPGVDPGGIAIGFGVGSVDVNPDGIAISPGGGVASFRGSPGVDPGGNQKCLELVKV